MLVFNVTDQVRETIQQTLYDAADASGRRSSSLSLRRVAGRSSGGSPVPVSVADEAAGGRCPARR